ncbi:hypothetical protein RhiirA5_407405 [Rhizophagus irregularis]|uniref:Uncharacterized protein n=1 Tax=Rhizophagus irregularis TaxID=588596 RepID=A0A2N0QAT1_9GLOM|nr:hypothetical protein RhiirA5_407405 [Rhizophagus irregularis]
MHTFYIDIGRGREHKKGKVLDKLKHELFTPETSPAINRTNLALMRTHSQNDLLVSARFWWYGDYHLLKCLPHNPEEVSKKFEVSAPTMPISASPSNSLEAEDDYYKMLLEDCVKILDDDGYGGYNEYGECDRGYYCHDGRYKRRGSPMMSPIISPVTA